MLMTLGILLILLALIVPAVHILLWLGLVLAVLGAVALFTAGSAGRRRWY